MKRFNFNAVQKPTWEVELGDSDHTVVHLSYSYVGGQVGDVCCELTAVADDSSTNIPDTTLTITDGVKIDASTGEDSSASYYAASDYIEVADGYTYTLTRTAGTGHMYFSCKVCYYDANKNYISASGTVIDQTTADAEVAATVPIISNAAYFRLRIYSDKGKTAVGVFTLTASSGSSTAKSGWCSTGHAFVPADYEDRITALETDGGGMKNRIRTLESSASGEIVPDYVIAEANRVISEVMQKQTNSTITFLAISDMHNLESSSSIRNGNLHAGQAAKIIVDSIGLDFAAMLGDVSCGAAFSTVPGQSSNDVIKANQYIADAFKGVDNFRTNGNHDPLTVLEDGVDGNMTQGQMYALIGRYNGNGKSYFYRDYEDKKVRVIMLNTVDENNSGGAGMTAAQLLWFAQSLDLSSKSNASEWQILILSHHPLDWNQYSWGTNLMNAANILAAYLEGSSITFTEDGVTNSYNFSGKNSATIIGQIHGHLHNYKVDNIYSTLSGAIKPTSAKRIAIPNACCDRNNTYAYEDSENLNGIEYGEFQTDGTTPLTYSKTAGTAEDTAFCVVTIDLDKKKIYAHHYGAGVDRVITYG